MPRSRVLIIEKCADVAQLEASLARTLGCSGDVTVSASEARQLLEQRSYDAVLIGSPIHVGPDELLLEVLVHRFPALARRTIVLTTFIDDMHLRSRFEAAGVYAVVAKPFDVGKVSRVITRCIRNAGAPGPTLWIGLRDCPSAIYSDEFDGERSAPDHGGRNDTESVEVSPYCSGMLDS